MIETIQKHAENIKNGLETVKPGMPFKMTTAATVGDGVWQGDLGLEVIEKVPSNYVKVNNVGNTTQLVRGNTIGSRHCLDSLQGVELYHPNDWSDESLFGPVFITSLERTVLHPTHGAVVIPAGMTILCRYQREWDKELAKERRTRD